MSTQLIEKECGTGTYSEINPVTSTDSVTDVSTGEKLSDILARTNHVYLSFKDNSKRSTRLQVQKKMRRRGLWITYINCQNKVVTEWYNGTATDDSSWGDDKNWVEYMDKKLIIEAVKSVLSWYKA